MIGNSVYIYLDDIIIASKDVHSHMETLRQVLERLQKVGLKIKMTTCEFLKPKIQFLAYVVEEQGINTVDDKVAAVAEFPQPKTVNNVRSFLGLAGYYRSFIKGSAARSYPLIQLLKKDVLFHWGKEQESSFKDLKHALTHAAILTFPNFKDPFFLQTDACMSGIGAVLMQIGDTGKRHVIAFASRVLQPGEKNYSATHLEILAVVWALQHFLDINMGCKITVYTDHSAVTEIFKGKHFSGRLARWYLTIQAYSPEIKYMPGKSNVVADALSRNVAAGVVVAATPTPNFSLLDLWSAQREHHVWKKVIYALESGDESQLPELPIPLSHFFLSHDGVLCRYWKQKPVPTEQLVIPDKLIPVAMICP